MCHRFSTIIFLVSLLTLYISGSFNVVHEQVIFGHPHVRNYRPNVKRCQNDVRSHARYYDVHNEKTGQLTQLFSLTVHLTVVLNQLLLYSIHVE